MLLTESASANVQGEGQVHRWRPDHQEQRHCQAPQSASCEAPLQHAGGGCHQGCCEGHSGQADEADILQFRGRGGCHGIGSLSWFCTCLCFQCLQRGAYTHHKTTLTRQSQLWNGEWAVSVWEHLLRSLSLRCRNEEAGKGCSLICQNIWPGLSSIPRQKMRWLQLCAAMFVRKSGCVVLFRALCLVWTGHSSRRALVPNKARLWLHASHMLSHAVAALQWQFAAGLPILSLKCNQYAQLLHVGALVSYYCYRVGNPNQLLDPIQ